MKVKLDVKDKKILEELLINSRIPFSILSKKVGLSREVTAYRLKKLQKDIITGFFTQINLEALGFYRYGVLMQLKGINSLEEKKFLEYLKNQEYVTYLSPLIGKWNLAFDIIAKTEEHLKEIINRLTQKVKIHLESYVITRSGIDMESYPTKYFGKTHQHPTKKYIKTKYVIDDTDKNILKILATDSRVEYRELSSKLKFAANTIKYRIKNLEKHNIIRGYSISIDYRRLGYEFYNIQLKLHNVLDDKFLSYIKNHPIVMFYYKHLGQENWDMDIGVIVKSSLEFRNFMIELKDNFPEIIKINDMYLIVEETKADIAPEGVFK
ncbi:MAG: Lrp/AsnC family transcriptional regulator [Candidatus Woesearchaeota archaeon]